MAGKDVQEDLDAQPGAGKVRPLHSDKIVFEDVYPKLVAERGLLSHVLVGTEGVPPLGDPLLLDVEVGPVDCHETIVQLVIYETAVKIDL